VAVQIVAIQMDDRNHHAPRLQEVLTSHGCNIKVRLGVPDMCDGKGLILLVVEGEEGDREALLSEIRGVPSARVSSIDLPPY